MWVSFARNISFSKVGKNYLVIYLFNINNFTLILINEKEQIFQRYRVKGEKMKKFGHPSQSNVSICILAVSFVIGRL